MTFGNICLLASVSASIVWGTALVAAADAGEIRFNRDVRPILSDHCFACHGPDAATRKAKLRLDVHDGAVAEREHGAAIVPGKPEESSVLARVLTTDMDDVMPPPDVKKPLTSGQIETLRAWIRQGAPYEGHWAYEPIDRPAPPKGVGAVAGDTENPIDRFVDAKLAALGLARSPEADRRTLFRRLSLDLTGLPPKPWEAEAFAEDTGPGAFGAAVETLLKSPRYGERMAVFWLDLVRYADTVGYHGDQDFEVWPYRDYVIRAFNENMRFDQFTRENLAGDLFADPTRDQLVASGYNRLLMITAEGGAQDREYRTKYAADRVRNVSTVWLGVTLGCAECHDHKYDPFTARDFYSFSAFFSDLTEKGFYDRGYPTGDWGPSIRLPDPAQAEKLASMQGRVGELETELKTTTPEIAVAQAEWERSLQGAGRPEAGPWHALGPFPAADFDAAFETAIGPEKGVELAQTFADDRLRWTEHPEWKDGAIHSLQGDLSATYLFRTVRAATGQDWPVGIGSDDAVRVWLNGQEILANKVTRAVSADQEKPVLKLKEGENELLLKIVNGTGGYAFTFKPLSAAPAEILDLAQLPMAQRNDEQQGKLAAHYRLITPLLAQKRAQLVAAKKDLEQFEGTIPRTLVSKALPEPRTTRILRRGNWLDDGGEIVMPAVPGFLAGNPEVERRLTRKDLAEWVVSRENPLTARVFVNRLWKQFFGSGLSRKLEDIGAQGEWPSHPELLDWLASEFRDSGWNVKHMVRLMVTSAAYRQRSTGSERLREIDSDNRLLARQSAVRLDAEFVRDGALALSGLLVHQLGGPSVRPYQPAGYYSQLNFPKREYEADRGRSQYRRGLYSHWQRTFLHPSLAAFDAPTREECTAERVRSNTPQQALVLLNDPTYVEAARVFAERMIRAGGASVESRIQFAFREALSRSPKSSEMAMLRQLASAHLAEFQEDPEAAKALLATGLAPVPGDIPPAELAAWTSVARAILNLHEVITRS